MIYRDNIPIEYFHCNFRLGYVNKTKIYRIGLERYKSIFFTQINKKKLSLIKSAPSSLPLPPALLSPSVYLTLCCSRRPCWSTPQTWCSHGRHVPDHIWWSNRHATAATAGSSFCRCTISGENFNSNIQCISLPPHFSLFF